MNEKAESSFDPHLVLVEWFTSRTERGRITWNVEMGAIRASVSLPPIVHLRFVTRTDAGSECVRWDSFYVRNNHTELLRIDSDHPVNSPATIAVINALFQAALKPYRHRVEYERQAIQVFGR